MLKHVLVVTAAVAVALFGCDSGTPPGLSVISECAEVTSGEAEEFIPLCRGCRITVGTNPLRSQDKGWIAALEFKWKPYQENLIHELDNGVWYVRDQRDNCQLCRDRIALCRINVRVRSDLDPSDVFTQLASSDALRINEFRVRPEEGLYKSYIMSHPVDITPPVAVETLWETGLFGRVQAEVYVRINGK